MANGRNTGRKGRIDTDREGGRFFTIPAVVMESAAYLALSYPARALIMELALQCKGDDNGRLLLSRAHLKKRGWNSADVIQRAKNELLEAGFIFETVQGHRPNKASWYAITWRKLNKLIGYDPGVAAMFEFGAYRKKNTVLIPSGGTGSRVIGPSDGTKAAPAVP